MTIFIESLDPASREIARYLLTDVTEEVGDRIGERSVVDLEYGELVEGVELDLIEAYLREQLSPEDRCLYETHFLVTKDRREMQLALQAIFGIQLRRRKEEGKGGKKGCS
jgi:hypothetical protein